MLSLVPTPGAGTAPLPVNVTATASAGVPPYSVSVCFATVDHSSPPPSCGNTVTGWNGTGPLEFAHLYATAGNFSVTGVLTDAQRASVGSTVLIVVAPASALVATAAESGTAGVAPFSVQFTESVMGETPPVTIQWAFGDGSSGSSLPGVAVNHTYTAAGVYWPSLTVRDGSGHSTVRTLAAVSISAPASGLLGLGPVSPWETLLVVVGLFLLAAAATAVVVRAGLRQRWRREGNELVERMRTTFRAPRPPPAP